MNLEDATRRKEMMDVAWDQGKREGRMYAIEHEYVSVERLRSMTLDELCELLERCKKMLLGVVEDLCDE